jgi:aryl carrier-like protein
MEVGMHATHVGNAQELQHLIAELYREQFGTGPVDPQQNFFALGGTSMQGLKVLGRLERTAGVSVRLADLYAQPTAAGLATLLCARQQATPARRTLAQIARARRATWRPLALSQQAFHNTYRAVPEAGFANAVLCTRFTGDADPEAICRAVERTAQRQSVLRARFGEADGAPAQRITPDLPPVTRVDLTARSADPVAGLAGLLRREHRDGFNLADTPPARFTLARTADQQWTLVSTVHHIVFDGWSCGVLHDELVESYRAETGDAAPRPPLAAGYADFAEWQHETLRDEHLERHLDYLAGQLAIPPPQLCSPSLDPGYTCVTDRLAFPADCHAGLAALARSAGAAEFSAIVLAVLLALRRATGVPGQALAIQTANRSWPGSEGLIGCFANVLPVRCELTGDDPAELLSLVHVVLGRAFEHEELPLDAALEALARRSGQCTTPAHLAQVGLTLNPSHSELAQLPDLRIETRVAPARRTAIDPTGFPLVLEFAPHRGTLIGHARRLADHWPGESYPEFALVLEHQFRQLAAALPVPLELQ